MTVANISADAQKEAAKRAESTARGSAVGSLIGTLGAAYIGAQTPTNLVKFGG